MIRPACFCGLIAYLTMCTGAWTQNTIVLGVAALLKE